MVKTASSSHSSRWALEESVGEESPKEKASAGKRGMAPKALLTHLARSTTLVRAPSPHVESNIRIWIPAPTKTTGWPFRAIVRYYRECMKRLGTMEAGFTLMSTQPELAHCRTIPRQARILAHRDLLLDRDFSFANGRPAAKSLQRPGRTKNSSSC